ncbi:hypothetical protein I3U63_23325 [Mycobacteroides abscessus subsp. massiliense]|uniref:hypothetical protein n=1 Tax=Mycobacteroides abscessus TaxID=36809 RepID=UPI0019D265C2|nr:hypothetical protein [Mycobacteroides abscessus]MBN7324449.1 hypothetical protein [Mycobacteroides abscessus subsp. massiliense]
MTSKEERAIDDIINRVLEWQDEANRQVTTTEDDEADVIASHDSAGRLIELIIKPGLPRELDIEELETAINDAMADNINRGKQRLDALAEKYLDISDIGARFPNNTADGQALVDAFRASLNG